MNISFNNLLRTNFIYIQDKTLLALSPLDNKKK